ncbi:hypothetical protein ADK52_38260 [Streptomyces sp. WM6372]|uniref:hypothetical protein n=1 Tax=Streptomyces sp. WM6372 TaxID=1415555 RepID=UPI0006B0077A|nr:hypothetical protein [Streptomyces sp. WM6372]KOU13805.1 hypothetical protein ADK52_38260 [Streptomyces sp. WM6372]
MVPGKEGTAYATCDDGSVLVGGSYLMSRPVHVLMSSRASTPNTWVVTVLNTHTENATFSAVAECAP